jgi:hypothetical protein
MSNLQLKISNDYIKEFLIILELFTNKLIF